MSQIQVSDPAQDKDPDDIGWVLSTMLFPRDDGLRNQFFAVHRLSMALHDLPSADYCGSDVRSLRLILQAPSDGELYEMTANIAKDAYLAGALLAAMYLMERCNISEPSKRKALDVTSRWAKTEKYGDGSPMPFSKPKIRQCWNQYQSVAHFWAAILLNQDYAVDMSGEMFSEDSFYPFLERAAELLDFGSSFLPYRAKRSEVLVDYESAWKLPEFIEKRRVSLDTVPDKLLEALESYKAPLASY